MSIHSERADSQDFCFHYRLRSLLMCFVLVAAVLSGAVPLVRWLNSRPGILVTNPAHWPIEMTEIEKQLGNDELQDEHVWHLHNTFFSYVWRAMASPEAVKVLQAVAQTKPIPASEVPGEFWKMPPDWSEMPDWWDAKPVAGAKCYMSPAFFLRSVGNDRIDCVAMYDPEKQVLYVWSQWDF